MFQLMPGARTAKARLTRRDLIRMSALGAFGIGMGHQVETGLQAATIAGKATAKNCIYIFLCGGPSQLDMWDPKPSAPDSIRGTFKPISTNVPGIQIGDLLPRVSQHADTMSIVRSMHHDTASHDLGILRTLLADKSELTKAYPPKRSDRPSLGALLSYLYGAQGQLPPWVVLPRYFMTGDRFYRGQTAGLLGNRYDALELGAEKKSSLSRTEFSLEHLDLSKSGQDIHRLTERKQLLGNLARTDLAEDPAVRELDGLVNRAYDLFTSQSIRQVFDVTRESKPTRERYGMNEYGQSFLLARRLVEANVRMVNLFWTFYGDDGCQFNLWTKEAYSIPRSWWSLENSVARRKSTKMQAVITGPGATPACWPVVASRADPFTGAATRMPPTWLINPLLPLISMPPSCTHLAYLKRPP